MPLCLTEVTANTQQAATSLPKLNNLILSIKAMWQICYIFTWTLLKSEAPITGPERKRLFHRHSHTQLIVWLCVCVMRVCPGVIMCNSGKHVDGCVYRAFNHVYEGPFVHMCVCLTLSGCSLCSQFILMWIECANNSSAVRHNFISFHINHPVSATLIYNGKHSVLTATNRFTVNYEIYVNRALRTHSMFNFDSWLAWKPFSHDYIHNIAQH